MNPTLPAISSLTAAPTAPKSGIAPQELVGTVNFGLVLGDAEVGAGLSEGSDLDKLAVPLGEIEASDASQGDQAANALAFALAPALTSADLSGNSLPPGGLGLPPELQADPRGVSAGTNGIQTQALGSAPIPRDVALLEPSQQAAKADPAGPLASGPLASGPLASGPGVVTEAIKMPASLSGAAAGEGKTGQVAGSETAPGVQLSPKAKAEPDSVARQVGIDPAANSSQSSPLGARASSGAENTATSAAPNPQPAAQPSPQPALAPVDEAAAKTAVLAQAASARTPLGADLRIEAGAANRKAELSPRETQLRSAVSPVQPAALPSAEEPGEADMARSSQTPTPNLLGNAPSAQENPRARADTVLSPTSPQSQSQPQAIAAPTAPQPSSQPSPQPPALDTSGNSRLAAQLESTIEQLTETRSAAQASRPELTVRHQEFGAITMRLEAMGNDLRATLSARDPGFVPAIQNALAERAVAASSETASTSGQRGAEQGSSQSNSQSGNFSGSNGQGWHSEGRYGSSTGSGQGTSQPYSGQTDSRDEDPSSGSGANTSSGPGSAGDGELFA